MMIVAWVLLILATTSLVGAVGNAILVAQGRIKLPAKTLVVMFSAFAMWIVLGGLVIVAWVIQYDYHWLSDPRQVTAAYMHLIDRAERIPFWRWFLGVVVTSGFVWYVVRLGAWFTRRDPRTLERR
jgi:hypothetical protein